jgi:hypothetical protein
MEKLKEELNSLYYTEEKKEPKPEIKSKPTLNFIDQNKVFEYLKEDGYDVNLLLTMFDLNNVKSIDKGQFNQTLRNIHRKSGIDIFDMILCFHKYFLDCEYIYEMIDLSTRRILEKEAKIRDPRRKIKKPNWSELI